MTLAAAFSIPMVLDDGSVFPERNLILFICAGVILMTLIVASASLPLLTKRPEEAVAHGRNRELQERDARIRVLEAGLCSVREEITDDNKEEAFGLIKEYNYRLQRAKMAGDAKSKEAWRKTVLLRMEAIRAERNVIMRWEKEGLIAPEITAKANASLSRVEMVLSERVKLQLFFMLAWRTIKRLFNKKRMSPEHPSWELYKQMKLEAIQAAIAQVKAMRTKGNEDAVRAVTAGYREMEHYLISGKKPGSAMNNSLRRELELKALQSERNEIQELFENREIGRALAGTFRMEINYREAGLFESQPVHEE